MQKRIFFALLLANFRVVVCVNVQLEKCSHVYKLMSTEKINQIYSEGFLYELF